MPWGVDFTFFTLPLISYQCLICESWLVLKLVAVLDLIRNCLTLFAMTLCCRFKEFATMLCFFWLYQGVPGDLATESCRSLSQGRGPLADGSQVKVARCEFTMSYCRRHSIVESLLYHPLSSKSIFVSSLCHPPYH